MNFQKIIFFIISFSFLGCNKGGEYKIYEGKVFGTYYKFQIDSNKDFQKSIDSVFLAINQAANSYTETSEISKFNISGELLKPSTTFLQMLDSAKTFYQVTNQYFNPALYPLINEWGFGAKGQSTIDSVRVDSLLKITDFKNVILFDSNKVKALQKGAMLDLNGLGEGYALDQIGKILDRGNVQNYMIEIGGEMKCRGINNKLEVWKVGIEDPTVSIQERGTSLMTIVKLDNQSISTSGSYRKFYTDSLGNKYSHIISPINGYPINHNLLSVSIISTSATQSDAIATACMAMGTEKAISFIESMPHLNGYLIYDQKGELKKWQSANFPK